MEDNNFGWTETQFLAIQEQMKKGNTTTFEDELIPLKIPQNGKPYRVLSETMASCVVETTALLCTGLGETAQNLSDPQKKQMNTFVMESLDSLKQAMVSDNLEYGDVKAWVRDKTFEDLKAKYMEQNFGWTPEKFLILKEQLLTTDLHKSDATVFRAELRPFIDYLINYVRNLTNNFHLASDEKGLILDAVIHTLTRFEQRMDASLNLKAVNYGNLKDWASGHAYSKFLELWGAERKRKGSTDILEIVPMPPNEEEGEDLMVGLVAKTLEQMPDEAQYFYQTTLRLRFWKSLTFQEIADYLNEQYADLLSKKIKGNTLSVHVKDKVFPLFKTELEKRCAQFGILDIDLTSLFQTQEELIQH